MSKNIVRMPIIAEIKLAPGKRGESPRAINTALTRAQQDMS